MDLLTITQMLLKKLLDFWNNDIAVASDHAALRVSVMQWRLEALLPTVQYKNALTVFGIAINRKFHEIND